MTAPNRLRTVALIARREFLVQLRAKSFLISTGVVLLALVAGIAGIAAFGGEAEERTATVAVVGDDSLTPWLESSGAAIGTTVTVAVVPDESAARHEITSGTADAALVPGTGGAVVVTETGLDDELRAVLASALAGHAQEQALRALEVDPAAVRAAAEVRLDERAIDPPDPAAGERAVLSMSVAFVLYLQILLFGVYVAMGVVEEKSSRVVEVLLATVRPLQLLWGKIIGLGVAGLLQLTLYGVAGVGTALGTGVLTLTGTALGTLAGALGWFVLGFLFFAVLYAAAGSLVSRQEDVNSTTTPLTVLIVAMFGIASVAVRDPDGALSATLSWVPPFSAILMPLRIAAGVATPAQIAGTVLLMVAVTAGLSLLAARVYERSVLRTGGTVSWRQALRG
ncbi:ABC transporter permease [Nocardia asteroides]|uniref:ABC transporter permease n=1 Tax=Nocardia asteroides TaxID=1824 RepID=UPI001E5B2B1C|nr:ABC transporter permease [Nocardia asteroides]UGT63616.1 ABC transporter permease [Nocardia asteroides]